MRRAASFALALALLPASAEAATLIVCPEQATARDCAFKGDRAIQAAVDQAKDGDVVLVRAGTYVPRAARDLAFKEIMIRAFVAIDGKRITLRGEPGTILDGSRGLPVTGIGVKNADVAIDGFHLTGFRYDIEEDDIYEGHGIFAVDSRVRIVDVEISRFQKMGLTGRGATTLDVTGLTVLDGHVGSWLYEGAYMRLDRALFRGNDSAALAAYNDSAAHLSRIAVDGSADDAIYAEDDATIHIARSLVIDSKPIALNATGRSRIFARQSLLHGNDADTSATGVTLGEDIIRSDPMLGAGYRPRAGSPIEGKGIGPAGEVR